MNIAQKKNKKLTLSVKIKNVFEMKKNHLVFVYVSSYINICILYLKTRFSFLLQSIYKYISILFIAPCTHTHIQSNNMRYLIFHYGS